ncbi:MAG: hypothetical protein SF187_12935 [Deltaproteobacteria bacterium]|nr:hypothetical protein [Deltaproteobacteria bacterium]
MSAFSTAMKFTEKEDPAKIIGHILFGLHREGLISAYASGNKETVVGIASTAASDGVAFVLTPGGVELFLWAHGLQDSDLNDIITADSPFEPFDDVQLPPPTEYYGPSGPNSRGGA